MVALGLQEATTVVIGNSVGDNQPELARRYFTVTRNLALPIFATIATVVSCLRSQIIAIFTKDPLVTVLSINVMTIVAIHHIVDGMQGYLQGVIRGLGLQKQG